jgi:glycosyltransferase involved in cell wall biosynthesis
VKYFFNMDFSIIVPLYNRPDEIDELLDSLTKQTHKYFEVIIVEDGSTMKADGIINKYKSVLTIQYFYKENEGPGLTRNYGAQFANGKYLIFFDSDCIVPKDYMQTVANYLTTHDADFFGGPDRANKNFTPIQKAINYSMTSFFTTGGIRGGKNQLEKFHPRSFNLGVKKSAFNSIKGFSELRFGEDIDLSIRLFNKGYKSALINDAWVYHKRRTDFKKFFRQIYNSGIARINLFKLHPESLKVVHFFPSAFTVGIGLLVLLSFFNIWFITPIVVYILVLFIDSTIRNSSLEIGLFSVIASFIQLISYGLGFIESFIKRVLLKKVAFTAFLKNFYD